MVTTFSFYLIIILPYSQYDREWIDADIYTSIKNQFQILKEIL